LDPPKRGPIIAFDLTDELDDDEFNMSRHQSVNEVPSYNPASSVRRTLQQ
jgi:hypothetical protein